jgi:hypothetical protein
MFLIVSGQLKALQDEANHPRNVHRWIILQETNPRHWALISMKLGLTESIDIRQKQFDELQEIKNKMKKSEFDFRDSYGGAFKEELDAINKVLQEKNAQLKEMEMILKLQKSEVEDREKLVRNAKREIRELRLDKSSERQRSNERKLAVGEMEGQPIRPPKFPAGKRAPGRFVGGGFGIGKVDGMEKGGCEIPRLELAEIEMREMKRRPHTSRTQAVVLPGASKKGNNQNWAARPKSTRVKRE